MTPDVTLWQQLEHYFSLRMRLNISQKEAQMKMAEQISTMKVVVNVVRKPTFSNRSSPWDYLVLSWTEMLYNRSAVPGGIVNTVCWQEAAGGPTGSVLDPPLSTWEWLGWYSETSLSPHLVSEKLMWFPVSTQRFFVVSHRLSLFCSNQLFLQSTYVHRLLQWKGKCWKYGEIPCVEIKLLKLHH